MSVSSVCTFRMSLWSLSLILSLSEYNVMLVFFLLFYLFIYFNNVGPIRVSLHHYTNTF